MNDVKRYCNRGVSLILLGSHALYAGSLSLSLEDKAVDEEFNSATISVTTGSASYRLDKGPAVKMGDGTVEDYAFYNALGVYAQGMASVITSANISNADGGPVKNHDSIILTDDIGEFKTGTGVAASLVTGVIDLSSYSSGTVYIFFGSYSLEQNVELKATLSGSDLTDMTQTTGPVAGDFGVSRDRYAVALDFVNEGGYDTLTYTYTNDDIDGSRSRFYGVVVDAAP